MQTLKDLLLGKRVRMTEDCGMFAHEQPLEAKIESDRYGYLFIEIDRISCFESSHWLLLDPLSYTPEPHRHKLACTECGEEEKQISRFLGK